jgi:hypothetical protein
MRATDAGATGIVFFDTFFTVFIGKSQGIHFAQSLA